jgi:hypothetical protein
MRARRRPLIGEESKEQLLTVLGAATSIVLCGAYCESLEVCLIMYLPKCNNDFHSTMQTHFKNNILGYFPACTDCGGHEIPALRTIGAGSGMPTPFTNI